MTDTETHTTTPRKIVRESKVATELEAQMARIRQQIDDVTSATIATITAPPVQPARIAEVTPPPVEAVSAEAVFDEDVLAADTRRRFEAYGRSIASALSGLPLRRGGTRRIAS